MLSPPSLSELTLLAGLGEVLSSVPSALLGIFRPPYFFQYIQQETHRRHCMLGGPQEYHWADCMAVDEQETGETHTRTHRGGHQDSL